MVTGASSGLGVVFAEALAEAGADVTLGARRKERLDETRERLLALGRRSIAVQADVSIAADCERLATSCQEVLGGLDVLVNKAGMAYAARATHEDPADFRRLLDVNLTGSFLMAQACGRLKSPGGSIVNVGSILGSRTLGLPQAAYSSSKAGIEALTRDLAAQWTGRKGLRVNALSPGIFPSEMTGEYSEEYLAALTPRIPSGRLGEPNELAAALIFLASDASSYVSGAVLAVDGGLSVA